MLKLIINHLIHEFNLKNIYFIYFLQRERERNRELETSMREKHQSAASCTPPPGDVPTTKVHALDWNRTWDLSACRPTLYPLSQSSFGLHSLHSFFSCAPGLWQQLCPGSAKALARWTLLVVPVSTGLQECCAHRPGEVPNF